MSTHLPRGAMNVSRGYRVLLNDHEILRRLPEEQLDIIRNTSNPSFLDTIAILALDSATTLRVFTSFENIFADICARWIANERLDRLLVIESFARILPFAPHLSTYLQTFLRSDYGTRLPSTNKPAPLNFPYLTDHGRSLKDDVQISTLPTLDVTRLLLATYRLLRFGKKTFSKCISAIRVQSVLQHADPCVQYLAIRISCILLSASDLKLQEMLDYYISEEQIPLGQYDDVTIDYTFLSLYEQKKVDDVARMQQQVDSHDLEKISIKNTAFSPFVKAYGSIMLPRPLGSPLKSSSLIDTVTTSQNLENLSEALLTAKPILVHGVPGAGKSSLVNDIARELGKDSTMVTLHLNEQTDAKMLIGMYTTDTKPGSFKWRAGVLTTAIREGRWVFIEDLDRAPNDVISVILPLIERGELLVPSRGETIQAAEGFRLIASVRTSLNMSGIENPPSTHMLGSRLWHRVPIQMPAQTEFTDIIKGLYPTLHKFLPMIIAVYQRLCDLSRQSAFASKSRTSLGRPISPRDLLKWCRRLSSILESAGSRTGAEPVTDGNKYDMFMEAADCFASSIPMEDIRRVLIGAIAEEMHIAPAQCQHFLTAHIPTYEARQNAIHIGRTKLSKKPSVGKSLIPKKSRPFANTKHAKRLLEQVAVAVKLAEPVLLVGETGIGKTTVIQQLADSLGFKLSAVNLSQQSEAGDLLGGFKPVNVRSLALPIKEEFDTLVEMTNISKEANKKYFGKLNKFVLAGEWSKASRYWQEGPKMFTQLVSALANKEASITPATGEQPPKRRKIESKLQALQGLKPRWDALQQQIHQFDILLSGGEKGFAFTFVEGNIIKAVRNGEWVLLDEINLASPDTLEAIADLLHSGPGSRPSILLSETGEIERIEAHPDFRIFGAMNPATDIGKRDLPMGLRSRFTEIYVESPDRDLDDLLQVIEAYLGPHMNTDKKAAHNVANLYMKTKDLANGKSLVDGASQIPHFSLRTLTRVLSYVTEIAPSYGLRRALYEGYAMGFLTLLNRESEMMLLPLIDHYLLETHGNPKALLSQSPRHPEDGKQYVSFKNKKRDRQYWMLQGDEIPQEDKQYIITPFVERNMLNLVRATSTRRFPVLVQGPTSAGKTSMIEYLAKFSGQKFVRINNHEHTDLQEYLGTYVSGQDGQLKFQEGLLVQALRQGHWIVLDELNLAPTDVLEALNRLLDDNRELLIPETQEIVRPHENFMLFATQNPPGLYGGRKTLSRAFRNRFLELHFDDIPENELETILQHRSQKVAPSDCKRIVNVYKELSRLRQSSRLFEQKDSFATLRDLFRWSLRDAENREELAANGYMLLAERVRNAEERIAVKEVIERVMKVKIDTSQLYSLSTSPEIARYNHTPNSQGVVWTQAMRRLYILVSHALRNNEPVLLVGETGCGKTTVCQMLAEAFSKELHIVNAHQNTETGDLIGAQRPVRSRAVMVKQLEALLFKALDIDNDSSMLEDLDSLCSKYDGLTEIQMLQISPTLREEITQMRSKTKALFEWSDGSLVQAMRSGHFFLLDEISLADDSVLERLNSVLEPGRTILLAEKGITDSFVKANDDFQFFATMNPGGDYGKRELSPALRNRFTEIWVPSLSEYEDILLIVETKLHDGYKDLARYIVQFAEWFGQTYKSTSAQIISVRDVLAWITFMNRSQLTNKYLTLLHGAAMVYIDTLGANPAALLAINPATIEQERAKCLSQLSTIVGHDMIALYSAQVVLTSDSGHLSFGDFKIERLESAGHDTSFAFDAPTTKSNAMRVVRALQLNKPILLEGSPGVGKTTLVAALARAVGRPLTRINLSEQTDLMDLFGSDVPVEGADAGNFAWRDAPFLQAMQRGDWVLLDEMNLASQSVLEGLNACLDHRGEVYISELDQTFTRHPNFSVFAAQNPHHQGGGRKGLPSSFVNRFTVVYADVFKIEDLTLICKRNFPSMDDTTISNVISFVSALEQEVVYGRQFGSQGGPWEFNLRDTLRWLHLLVTDKGLLAAGQPADFLNLIFRQRFRTVRDREQVDLLFARLFESEIPTRHLFPNMALDAFQVGLGYLPRDAVMQRLPFPLDKLNDRLPELESLMICVQQNLPCILVGPSGCGKTVIIEHIAAAAGVDLVVFPLNADIDTMDLVGGFEQMDPQRAVSAYMQRVLNFVEACIASSTNRNIPDAALGLLYYCQTPEVHWSLSQYLQKVLEQLQVLCTNSVQDSENLIAIGRQLLTGPLEVQTAKFEWVDGVLVKALEEGKWLVLDNANLCSSSVLDRLNSLLEPNGALIINEHSGPDGESKLVKPHPNFRLFLTMDARFGELSRAMRNRCIEIYTAPIDQARLSTRPASLETQLLRYGHVIQAVESNDEDVAKSSLSILTNQDMRTANRFATCLPELTVTNINLSSFIESLASQRQVRSEGLGERIDHLYNTAGDTAKLSTDFTNAQVVNPLQNTSLVPLLQKATDNDLPYRLGHVIDLKLSMFSDSADLIKQNKTALTLKSSQMNRLQRSIVGPARISNVSKDSTVRVAQFLMNSHIRFSRYIHSPNTTSVSWSDENRAMQTLLRFCQNTYLLTTKRIFEEAEFQAHLTIGKENIQSMIAVLDTKGEAYSPVRLLLHEFYEELSSTFDSGFRLSTGLSMEKLWLVLRPSPTSNELAIQTILRLQEFAKRFDAVRWKVSIAIPELADTLNSILRVFEVAISSNNECQSLLEALETELSALENRVAGDTLEVTPFFASQFESFRQYRAISPDQHFNTSTELDVLSNYSTEALMLMSRSGRHQPLSSIEYLWGAGSGLKPIEQSHSLELLKKIQNVGEVSLNSLRLLETELPLLGQQLSSSSMILCQNQVNHATGIYSLLLRLIKQVVSAVAPELLNNADVNMDAANIRDDARTYISTAMAAIDRPASTSAEDLNSAAIAWINFAVACIILYVPDRSFDPDKRQRLARSRHQQLSASLQQEMSALERFEMMFTGQDSNLRSQIIKNEILELGEPGPELLEIYRPEQSELDQLQGEFNNLLRNVLEAKPLDLVSSAMTAENIQSIKLLQRNIVQIITRLKERFRAYDDMTVPVVGILRVMQIGLCMATMATMEESNSMVDIRALNTMTPFLGGQPNSIPTTTDHSLQMLSMISTTVAVEGLSLLEPATLKTFFSLIHISYEQWSKRLEQDRKDEEAKGGLYRFRGSAEDEEEDDLEEFDELFPAYDSEKTNATLPSSQRYTTKDTAVAIANLHAEIVLETREPSTAIISSIKALSQRIGKLYEPDNHSIVDNMTSDLLPGALLSVNDAIESLKSTEIIGDSYNFYLDANLPESRKLVVLVHQIQSRFRELQAVDEIAHMQPLEDVVVSCRELLGFRHTEPLAKIITKVEKVHTFMHEWQFGGWASKANSALTLYDNLTQTIVSWRRLELSTWARLFDMENKKCDEDARSWWFIAYQVVVAAPLGIVESEAEMRTYAQKLLQDLEIYFSTAIQGQYFQRMKLLEQLQKHLRLIQSDMPLLTIIADAVGNFLDIYSRYAKVVTENLRKGRVLLEKTMKDVILLASWKDTNIVALRDSAKRSHHKLFKLVRKHRALLGQPMSIVLGQGLPDESHEASESMPLRELSTVDPKALSICSQYIPGWESKSKRFTNVTQTSKIMLDTSAHPDNTVLGSEYIETFLADILDTMAELQKATPTTLTDENKVTVKHLKTRKRKLFADTIKDLRQMGVRHSLGSIALAKQESMSLVLSSTPSKSELHMPGLEYYYHRAIDMLPRARAAVHEHNEDLTNPEVIRSVGLLEGLLFFVVSQRNILYKAADKAQQLQDIVDGARALGANVEARIRLESTKTTYATMLKWMPAILKVAIELVAIHNKLGKSDTQDVIHNLQNWTEKFGALGQQQQALPRMPNSLIANKHDELAQAAEELTTELRGDLEGMTASSAHPELAFILNQILPWTTVTTVSHESRPVDQNLVDLDAKISRTIDSILVSMEKVKNAYSQLPQSSDDPSWLTKESDCLSKGIASLYTTDIITQIQECFEILRSVDLEDSNTSQAACAMFAVALPVFQQYHHILDTSIHRYAQLHRSTCKMTYILAKTFVQIAGQGFCTPGEKSNEQGGTDKLEGGTGLGDGEGAEDISKDIKEDENLDELAQEPNKDEKGDIEDEEDAVDMADGEMEGEMGEAGEKEDGDGSDEESGDDDIDEEAGDVDDLDPNAVDEKMWNGDGEKADKDQEGDESKGKADKDEQVAAQEKENNKPADGDDGEAEEEEEETAGAEQSEDVQQQEDIEKHDPHAQDGDVLELPDEMELDGAEGEEQEDIDSEDGLNDLEDADGKNDDEEEPAKGDDKLDETAEDAEAQEDQDMGDNLDVIDLDEEEDPEKPSDESEQAGEHVEEEPQAEPEENAKEDEGLKQDQADDDANADSQNALASEAQGTGDDQDEDQAQDNSSSDNKAQRDEGGKGGDSAEKRDEAAEDGETGRQANGDAPQDENDATEASAEAQPFKKLGDALEKWHRQQTKIRDAPPEQDKTQDAAAEVDGEKTEFQHLQDEDAQADDQALGTATEDQSKALDESMAIDDDSKDLPETFQPDEVETEQLDENAMEIEANEQLEHEATDAYEGRAGAIINEATRSDNQDQEDVNMQERDDLEDDVEEVDNQLEATHIEDPTALSLSRSPEDALVLWTHYESATRDLSLSLTEQLRLILAPTLATKMRGDFRTGKRLNIKRIIPYIASSYKRDKIWMRRSVPSKRSYQIMLAVDDSKSMGESGGGSLAFETLVMVSKSLSMLEVGEISVVGFGEDVRVAHEFDAPFSADAGPRIFQNFGFEQSRTNITKLVRESIDLFRAARAKASSSPADLWQLELIISDGVCDSTEHEPIRRLLREAIEERIMMVFVIVDDLKGKKKGESVMDLKEAKFVKNELTGGSEVRIVRYLDTFPFQYYLIVSDVRELPGVLATLLRQWFAEVADSG